MRDEQHRVLTEAMLIVARERLQVARERYERAKAEMWLQMYGPRP